MARRVAEVLADLEDVLLEDLRLNLEVAPHGVEQLVLAEQPARVLDQVAQDGERLRRQRDARIRAPQAQGVDIQAERREMLHLGAALWRPPVPCCLSLLLAQRPTGKRLRRCAEGFGTRP